MWNIGETEINGKIVKLQREKYNKLLDILPSLLDDVETFKKLCIIIDECTVKLNVLKLKEILEKFEIIEQDFSSKARRKSLILCSRIALDPDLSSKGKDQKFPFGGLIVYGNSSMVYFFFQNPKFLDSMQFYMTLLDLGNLPR